jgi:SAM-dependent methyltransferase
LTDHAEYFEYLQGRSFKGLVYRKLWLYPAIKRHLSGRVLDVGSGIGDFLHSCPDSVGVDVNPLLVEACRKRGLDSRVMTPGNIPFPDASFGSVVLDNVLEHIENPESLLSEIRRVLTPGGTFVVGVPGPRGFETAPDHKVFYDEPTLIEVVSGAGFRSRQVFHMPLRSQLLYERMRQYCLYGVFHRSAADDVAVSVSLPGQRT